MCDSHAKGAMLRRWCGHRATDVANQLGQGIKARFVSQYVGDNAAHVLNVIVATLGRHTAPSLC